MPQLDTVSYLYQYSWLLGVCFFSYVIVLKYFYPQVSVVLKSRAKKIIMDKSDLRQMEIFETRGVDSAEVVWDKLLRLREKQTKAISIVALQQIVNQIRKITH